MAHLASLYGDVEVCRWFSKNVRFLTQKFIKLGTFIC